MTGGVDEGYGPPKSSPTPVSRRDDEASADGQLRPMPRQSRPFRGWGAAASENGASISVWGRLVERVRSLFGRATDGDGIKELEDPDAFWNKPAIARPGDAPAALAATDLSGVWTQEARAFREDFGANSAAALAPDGADFAVDGEDLDRTMPTPTPVVPRPDASSVAKAEGAETTQPFTPFRDARDDFQEEDANRAPRSSARLALPEDGEKTDEFNVVPIPIQPDATAETRMVPGFFGRMFGKKAEAGSISAERAAAEAADDKVPFVLAKFRSFYTEVIRDKHQKSDVISGFATAVMGAGGATSESDPEFAAQLLSKRLSEMLELQSAESNWMGGDAARYYPEAQYAMVALADETFATMDWPGRPSWHKYMLEPKMYGTRGAELEFFKRIDRLLKEAPDDKGARDLARLYLMVIASGYRGKFRVPNVRRPLAEYRRRLYEYSHQRDPLELYARDRRVFPQAAAHTLVSRSLGRFTPAQKWVAVVLILSVLYLGVSHYAWRTVSGDLRDVMSRIESSISQPPSGSSTSPR